ncbi:hypothetical protein ACFYXS_37550 [Streptomyces sp. NPDC002574]|uniref:hypothetical protein n=1 Tax=Streptomyces sp. NPDC002574 TaxID=3364652 RepID=UPI0036A98141
MIKSFETVSSGDERNRFIHVPKFPVNYAQFYLVSNSSQSWDPGFHASKPGIRRSREPGPHSPGPGILRVDPGQAFLVTGLATGVIDLTVSFHHDAPAPLLAHYEDVVEASLEIDGDRLQVAAWGGAAHIDLESVVPVPNWLRLRYHARDMDRAYDATSDVPLDSFHLQIWVAPRQDSEVLAATSATAKRWLSK